jgi:hypothetical protein
MGTLVRAALLYLLFCVLSSLTFADSVQTIPISGAGWTVPQLSAAASWERSVTSLTRLETHPHSARCVRSSRSDRWTAKQRTIWTPFSHSADLRCTRAPVR